MTPTAMLEEVLFGMGPAVIGSHLFCWWFDVFVREVG
jgi:hypothetical protein